MTEAEWNASTDARAMLAAILPTRSGDAPPVHMGGGLGGISPRKLRRFAIELFRPVTATNLKAPAQSPVARLEAWKHARVGRSFRLTAYECLMSDEVICKRVRASAHDMAPIDPSSDVVLVGTDREPATCEQMIEVALQRWRELHGED